MEKLAASKPDKRIEPPNPGWSYSEQFKVEPSVIAHFAWLRTRFAIERTLMAWLRTSTALIGFGFTIVEIFERLRKETPDKPVMLPHAPLDFGLALIGAGILGSIIALREYRFLVRYMCSGKFQAIAGTQEGPVNMPLLAMCILISMIGVVAFTAVLFRLS